MLTHPDPYRHRRRATRPSFDPRPMRSFDARLSLLIDRAVIELESADPATVRKWRSVLRELEKAAGL